MMIQERQSQQGIFFNKTDIESIFNAQVNNRWRVSQTSTTERIAKLKNLENWILDNKQAIRDALYADLKRPAIEVDLTEIAVSLLEIRHTRRNLRKWAKPKHARKTPIYLTASSWTKYEPRGVVLIISPWNYSINLMFAPLAAAIAAGNCVILKPSEFSPNSSRLIESAVDELFPENEVAVLNGDKEVAIELLKKPFDHIFFTGSTETGKKVMEAASKNLSSVTLELGGKSPVIIDDSAKLRDAAHKIMWGKLLNSGQSCHAPDYLLVHEKVQSRAIENLKHYTQKMLGEDKSLWSISKDYARIVDTRHFNRLKKLFTNAIKDGAKVELGGEFYESDNYISPTIISNVSLKSDIMEEEIFGPILPVLTYTNINEVIKIVNNKTKPLALYIFSKNKQHVDSIISGTSAGTTCINDVYIQYSQTNLPFGGVNHSGMGKAHGFYAFQEFSNMRAVLKHHRFAPLKLVYPPYNRRVQKIADIIIKYF
ncbi:aldehyde dehydrogenase family protein [Candidatus Neomarinimicrobiota bacterium]